MPIARIFNLGADSLKTLIVKNVDGKARRGAFVQESKNLVLGDSAAAAEKSFAANMSKRNWFDADKK
jgi:hypothetical protein